MNIPGATITPETQARPGDTLYLEDACHVVIGDTPEILRRGAMRASTRYRLSFTSGGLLVREAVVAAPLYLRLRDWPKVRSVIDEENPLQTRTVASGRRLARELVQRLAES